MTRDLPVVPAASLRTSRRSFLALCASVAGAALLPIPLRLRALEALAATSFTFTPHERDVLTAAADTVVPGGTVQTRIGPRSVPSAGEAGAVDFVENLLSGAMIFAAGTRRPPYVPLPPGVTAPLFPAAGADPLWTVKRIGWFGDGPRPTRPWAWPSELGRLQGLYRDGVVALDAATAPLTFDQAPDAVREAVLRAMEAQEVTRRQGGGVTGDPFFLTFLSHLAQGCFGDPVYGGNRGWVYWDMIDFTGPSFVRAGGPGPGQGWTAEQMTGPFTRS